MTFALQGLSASKGIAIGRLYVADRNVLNIYEYMVWPRLVEKEVARFEHAVNVAREQLKVIKRQIPEGTPTEVVAFIDSHLLMLEDALLASAPVELIRGRRCNAEWALKAQRDALMSVFEAMDDPYLRTRKDDIDHVVNRILRILVSQDKPARERGNDGFSGRIVLAEDVGPADLVLMAKQGMAALLTEHGGPNSHTAILARSLRIPTVVGLHNARQYVRDDDMVAVDGAHGVILVAPNERLLRQVKKNQRAIERDQVARKRLRQASAVTADGAYIALQANVELPQDIQAAVRVGADGIGLYRTEFLFMNRDRFPDEEEQYQTYVRVVKALTGKQVTIRTLDLGADKQVEGKWIGPSVTSNPALGLRAVRSCLKDPSLFRPQLCAILRASAFGPVRIIIPMVSCVQEVMQVNRVVAECRRELETRGQPFDKGVAIGAMVEVPAAALCADLLARHLDFLSIGTNDLIQYAIAIDRIDEDVNYLYDPLHPGILRLLQMTIRAGQRANIRVGMCGEMAGDTRYTRLLLGMGLKELSVQPNALLEIKQLITESHVEHLKHQVNRLMRMSRPSARAALLDEINRGPTLARDATANLS